MLFLLFSFALNFLVARLFCSIPPIGPCVRIDQFQKNLTDQLSRADAAIATLESQKNYFEQLFTATYGANGIQAQK